MKNLITWGAHPAHGARWLKLHAYAKTRNAARLREGWELVFLAPGEAPAHPPVERAWLRAFCRCTNVGFNEWSRQ